MISFKKDIKPIVIDNKLSIMEQLLNQQLPVASSCHGEGICGMCRIRVLDGHQNLTEKTLLEQQFFSSHEFPQSFRLSCQCRALGPVVIDTDYW